MVNASLAEGRLPTSQWHAIVTPMLKKPGLDADDMSNYWPVSNLSFISKVVERVVASRLNDYLVSNDLLPRHQSAYRKKHLTETAMLRVWSDMLSAADNRQVTLLGLLDLSAAFYCVDHDLLVQRLQVTFGLTRTVLQWIRSFVTDRTQQITYERRPTVNHSTVAVRRPTRFGAGTTTLRSIYSWTRSSGRTTRHMSSLVRRRQPDICQHGTRRYSCDTDSSHSTDFVSCVNDLNDWMHARLRLNPTKTQVMWLGSSQLIKQVTFQSCRHKSKSSKLLVISESSSTASCHCQLMSPHCVGLAMRQLRPIVRSLTTEAARTLVHAFISCRLDYCNSLLYALPDNLIKKL